MKKTVIAIIFLLLVAVAFSAVFQITTSSPEIIGTKHQLNRFDFSNNITQLFFGSYDVYAEKLLAPEDFAMSVPEPDVIESYGEFQKMPYCTCRFLIPLEKGKTFGIDFESATYAMKMWINGVQVCEFGKVADNKDDFVADTGHFTYYFSPQNDTTEIVIQKANFIHSQSSVKLICIGAQDKINNFVLKNYLNECILAVTFLVCGFVFLGFFMLFDAHRQTLWMSLFSFTSALYSLISSLLSHKLFGYLSYTVKYRVELCLLGLMGLFVIMYFHELLKKIISNKAFITAYVAVGTYIITRIVLPIKLFTSNMNAQYIAFGLALACWLISVAFGVIKNRKRLNPSIKLVLISCIAISVCAIADTAISRAPAYTLSIGAIGFVFINLMVMVMEMFDRERELVSQIKQHEEMAGRNKAVYEMSKIRESFMANISHEMKNPLAAISSYAALSAKQIEKGIASEETVGNLHIVESEAVRLGKMVNRIKDSSVLKVFSDDMQKVEIADFMQYAKSLCTPLAEKNGNTVETAVSGHHILTLPVSELYQVFYNLVDNASRHSENSAIILSADAGEKEIVFRVRDSGDGMSREKIRYAFDMGWSEDNSTGRGLAICKDIVERFGGTIKISANEDKGITVEFIILCKGGESDE